MVRGLFSIPPEAELSENDCPDAPGVNASLSRFIGGRENALALYAYRKLRQGSAQSLSALNPLVLVGASGSGKSLLARILADKYPAPESGPRHLVLSGADYARAFAHAVDTQAVTELEARQIATPLLLLDDLQQLTGKTAAQHFLSRVLEERVAQGKVTLITAHRVPPAMNGITSGLASRLCEGMVVPLQAPAGPTKQAVMTELCRRLGIQISDEARQRLDDLLRQETHPKRNGEGNGQSANHSSVPEPESPLELESLELKTSPSPADSTKSGARRGARHSEPPVRNVPQIQRLVLELHHQQENRSEPLTADDVDQVLWLMQSERVPSVPRIVSAVARYGQQRVSELRGRSRKQAVAQHRALAMYLCRELTGKSYTEIGKYFDRRDHTTVLHACRQAERRLQQDQAIAHVAREIQSSLLS